MKVYDAPEATTPIVVAAKAEQAARLAASIGDGTMNTSPDAEVVRIYRDAGGTGPIYGKVAGAFAASEQAARKLVKERQPNAAMGGDLPTELALPRDFATVAELVRDEDFGDTLVLGDDTAAWRRHLEQFERAGFTHVALHHVGEEQDEFIEFARQLL